MVNSVDEERIRNAYAGMWKADGYDPHWKDDLDLMLRFLCRNGKEELVGMHIRDRSMWMNEMEANEQAEARNVRHVCETMHRAMKRWVDLSVFRLVKRTKEARVRCRFLCLQLLSVCSEDI